MPQPRRARASARVANKNGRTVQALRQRIRTLEQERDTYRKALFRLLPKERIRLTHGDIREMDESGLTLDQVLEELRKL